MKRKNNTLLSLVLPAVLCTALWGSAAPCVKKGYELFEIAAGDSFSQLVFAGWRFTLAGVLVLLSRPAWDTAFVRSAANTGRSL